MQALWRFPSRYDICSDGSEQEVMWGSQEGDCAEGMKLMKADKKETPGGNHRVPPTKSQCQEVSDTKLRRIYYSKLPRRAR